MTIDQVSPTVWETPPVNWSILASLVYGGSWRGAANRVWADEVCLGLKVVVSCITPRCPNRVKNGHQDILRLCPLSGVFQTQGCLIEWPANLKTARLQAWFRTEPTSHVIRLQCDELHIRGLPVAR